jgi:hypothetical protein
MQYYYMCSFYVKEILEAGQTKNYRRFERETLRWLSAEAEFRI